MPLNDDKGDIAHYEEKHDHNILGDVDRAKDDAMHFGHLSAEELAIELKLRKRIDTLIMPLVILVYLLNYIDRNNYAAARLQGLEDALNLTESQYETGLSLLFVGYILMQVPSNLLLNYIGRPSLYLGFFTTAWGLVSLLTSQVVNSSGILACRFILGLVEAPFFAGVLFYLSKWYTKSELNLRMAIFYSGSLISGAFGNLIAAGILSGLDGDLGLGAWQWLYIIEGAITMAVGIAIMFILPDFPDTWRLLSPEMKHVANRRLAIEAAEADVDEKGGMSQIQGMKLAFADPKTYILAIAYHAVTGAAGFQNFFPTLTQTLGYSKTISLLLVAPPYIFITIWSLVHAFASDKFKNRFWFFVYPVVLVIIGSLVFMFTNDFGPKYFSFFLLVFVFAQNGTMYAWIANAIPRPPAKRAAALAFINSVGNAASIWTPYTYRKSFDRHYYIALGIVIGLSLLSGIMGIVLRLYLQYQNRQLERMENDDVQLKERDLKKLQQTAEIEGIDVGVARQLQKGFRYMI
ncbi:MFS transporter [Polychaeton citri CBS 116435]|uniref:MFS transporter n=1 Tax=Polychaeton citri CBS 116435 TaxID=1314669 RepID=A0A9P4Q3W7_9PEZI|nr:MFS transporter [Polychaeton citri CBS 116435]